MRNIDSIHWSLTSNILYHMRTIFSLLQEYVRTDNNKACSIIGAGFIILLVQIF